MMKIQFLFSLLLVITTASAKSNDGWKSLFKGKHIIKRTAFLEAVRFMLSAYMQLLMFESRGIFKMRKQFIYGKVVYEAKGNAAKNVEDGMLLNKDR